MTENLKKETRHEILKDIIHQLHKGLSPEDARERFEKEVGHVSSLEIAELEQSLINDGVPVEEIKKFCNVHALIFRSELEKAAGDETFPSHPIYLFRQENREIKKLTSLIKDLSVKEDDTDLQSRKSEIRQALMRLKGLNKHYERKEQLLFPLLEKKGVLGPPKVMWGKDNEIRNLLHIALTNLDRIIEGKDINEYFEKFVKPVLEEVEGMIFKEENILFPMALQLLTPDDWVDILKESDEIGYVFIEKPAETAELIKQLKFTLLEEPEVKGNVLILPTGNIRLDELVTLLNTLPLDVTFVDNNDTVRYFSNNKKRIFNRTKTVIGRKVQNCHPPQSVVIVEKILNSFKEGTKDHYDFWINFKGRLIYIRYLALRDRNGTYMGTLEVTQDITDLKSVEGEKRLITEAVI